MGQCYDVSSSFMEGGYIMQQWTRVALIGIIIAMVPDAGRGQLQYAVKFVTGTPRGDVILHQGLYRTAVNIHNPNEDSLLIRAYFSEALPRTPGQTVRLTGLDMLNKGQSLEIDSWTVEKAIREAYLNRKLTPPTFLKGFVVINTSYELDVVGVYTVGIAEGWWWWRSYKVRSIDIEKVSPRRVSP